MILQGMTFVPLISFEAIHMELQHKSGNKGQIGETNEMEPGKPAFENMYLLHAACNCSILRLYSLHKMNETN
jgi:hypothetical protein